MRKPLLAPEETVRSECPEPKCIFVPWIMTSAFGRNQIAKETNYDLDDIWWIDFLWDRTWLRIWGRLDLLLKVSVRMGLLTPVIMDFVRWQFILRGVFWCEGVWGGVGAGGFASVGGEGGGFWESGGSFAWRSYVGVYKTSTSLLQKVRWIYAKKTPVLFANFLFSTSSHAKAAIYTAENGSFW